MVRGLTEVGVRTMGRVENVAEFNDIIVKNVGGSPIRLRDVGYVEDGMAEKRTFAQFHGQPAVTLEVRRQIGTNTVQVVDAIKKRLGAIRKQLPHGVTVEVVKDQAGYIKNSVKSLEEHLVLGSLLASFIVWLFIRDWRSVLISSIAIPTSIITTFTLIRAMDFTLNSMTPAGADSGRGHRDRRRHYCFGEHLPLHRREGHAAHAGGRPGDAGDCVGGDRDHAVAGDHLIPIAFMSGYARRFLNQFGWTMAMSILVSMLVAFTLTPSLSARLLRKKAGKDGKPKSHGPARLLRSRLRGRAGMVVAASVAGGGNLRGDLRLDVRYQSSHRPGLDAAGRSERAEAFTPNFRKALRSKRSKKCRAI